MKTFIIALLLVTAFGASAFNERAVASQEHLKEFVETCKRYAVEDEIRTDELKKYILDCVNEELEANGFAKVTLEALKLEG